MAEYHNAKTDYILKIDGRIILSKTMRLYRDGWN